MKQILFQKDRKHRKDTESVNIWDVRKMRRKCGTEDIKVHIKG